MPRYDFENSQISAQDTLLFVAGDNIMYHILVVCIAWFMYHLKFNT